MLITTEYLTVPNNSHMRHCACAISQSRAQMFIYLIFSSSVTVKIMIKVRVRVRVRVSCMVRVRFNNYHMSRKSRTASYLAMRHIWHDDTGSCRVIASESNLANVNYTSK